jgi:hypothetical protein
MSQNHDEITRKQIIANLKNTGDYFAGEIAQEIGGEKWEIRNKK